MYIKKFKKHSRLKEYLETMRFLSAGSDASVYIYDIVAGQVYFTDNFDEKYHLPPMTDGAYSITELIDLALSLLAQGKTYRQITTMTGISKSTLIRARKM